MKNRAILGAGLKYFGVGAVLLGLITPWAVAGPEQDNESAVKAFDSGDMAAAMGLWKKAAQQGFAPAQVWLAYVLDKAEEDEEAVEWYRKAAAQGDAAGEYGLGQMYAKGEGVKKDFEQARSHILLAAEKNYLDAIVAMMNASRTGGLGLEVDNAQAAAWEAKLIALSPGHKSAPMKDNQKTKKGNAK